jgi:hypothetical protein
MLYTDNCTVSHEYVFSAIGLLNRSNLNLNWVNSVVCSWPMDRKLMNENHCTVKMYTALTLNPRNQGVSECKAFYSVVQIWSPTPLPSRECCSFPPFGSWGDTLTCGWGSGGPNCDNGQTLWYSRFKVLLCHSRNFPLLELCSICWKEGLGRSKPATNPLNKHNNTTVEISTIYKPYWTVFYRIKWALQVWAS